MVIDRDGDLEADEELPAMPCNELVLSLELSRVGTEQDLQRLAQVVREWTLRLRAASHEWMPPANDRAPPPWHTDVVHASPRSFDVEIFGAYFSARWLQDLVDALHAARQHGIPISRISSG